MGRCALLFMLRPMIAVGALAFACFVTGVPAAADTLVVSYFQEYGFTSPQHTVFGDKSFTGTPVSGSAKNTGSGYSASAYASSSLEGLKASVNVSTDGNTPLYADAHTIIALDVVAPGCGLAFGQICPGSVVWTISADGTMSTTGSGTMTVGALGNGFGASANGGAVSGGGPLTGGHQSWQLAPSPFVSDGANPCLNGSNPCSDSSVYVELALTGAAGQDSNGVPNGLPGTANFDYSHTATVAGDVYDANGNLVDHFFVGPSAVSKVPEPSTLLLLSPGAVAVVLLLRKRGS